jgi:PAS domain S-box-containing protein
MPDSEGQYQILFQANPLPMWVYDVQTLIFLAVNNAAVEHYGYSREEFLARTILDIRPLEDVQRLKQVLPGSDTGLHRAGVWRHRKKNGDIIEADISSQQITFEGRDARLVLARDVTDIRRSTGQLRLLQGCVSRLSDVVIITEAEPLEEPGPKIIFVNDAFVRRTGYTREEALGRSPRFIQAPKASQPALERIWTALKAGNSIREEVIKYTKSGEEIWWEVEIAPVADESGRSRYFVAIERDVTERKRAEKALRKSEARLKEAQRVANIGSWEWNTADRKVIWSDELYRIFGLVPQSVAITVETFLKCVHPEEREVMGRKIENMRRHPRTLNETFRIIRPDGVVRYVLARGEAALDGAPKPVRIVGTVQDITDRRLAEEARLQTAKLEAANKELEAFSYSVSHDLRAPLRTIDGFARMLAEDCGASLNEAGRGYLEHIETATQRMAQLIQDLLALSQITGTEIRRARVDLSSLAEEIARELRESEPNRQAEISVMPGLVVNADPHLLRIALENLMRNAWKFTGKVPRTRIEVGWMKRDSEIIYLVRDNGAGFDMEFAHKLFGVFQRLHRETDFPGTGVGLAIVHRIITRHGGRIWAEAVPQQGATFFFTLPDRA